MIDTSTLTTELVTVENKHELATASDRRIEELKKIRKFKGLILK